MATECATTSNFIITFRPDNTSGKGRCLAYMKIVQTIKKSNLLSPTQRAQRSKLLFAEMTRVGGVGRRHQLCRLPT